MPLLNRRQPYAFESTSPADLDPEQEVWVVKATGEVCRTYQAYLDKVKLYKEPVWSCKYTAKGGLTLEDALAAEHKARSALRTFPAELEEQVCRAVHHSLLRVEELVSSIYDSLRPPAHAGAAADAAGGEQAAAAALQQDSPSPFGSKENQAHQEAAAGSAAAPLAEKPPAEGPVVEAQAAGGAAEPVTARKPEGAAGAAAAAAAAAAAGKSGKKPKTPKAPVSRPLLRAYIVENAEPQGPEHATKQAWVVRPELRQRYGLAEALPAEVLEQLAAAIKAPKKRLDAPRGLGTKLPAKKDSKKAAAGASPGGAASGGAGGGEAGGTADKPAKDKAPMVAVQAKPLEEVEKQYKEGTLKQLIVAALKAVRPEALTVPAIIEKAKGLGLRELEEKERGRLSSVLASDPNFLRLAKGAYSLHCFHPEKEQLVRAPQPREPRKSGAAAAAAAAGTPVPSSAQGEGRASTAGKKAQEAVPMVLVEAKSLEEVEKQYKEGTLKRALVYVLKAVQPEALTVQGIVDKAKELGFEGSTMLEEKQKSIANALLDPNFLRLAKGAYSLHCFHPEKEQLVRAPQPREPRKSGAAAVAGSGTPAAPGEGGEARQEKEAVPMVRVEAKPLEEVEKQYNEGTLKHLIVVALKAVRPEALTVQGIVDKAKELGLRELDDKQKQTLGQALASDPNFMRLSKGAYTLHCFHPEREQLVRVPQPKKRKLLDGEGEEPGSKRQHGSAAPDGDDEVDSITRAEQQVRQTKRALALHRAALEKAQADHDAAKTAYEADKQQARTTPTKPRTSDVHIPAEQLAQFEVTEEERQFRGESDDRKALLEHRHAWQKLQARVKELEKAKKAFLEGEQRKRLQAIKEGSKGTRAAETAYRKAEKALEHERRATESAEKASAAAEKKLEKEKDKAVRDVEKAKEREEREQQKLVEREERERRRAEAAKAKEEARRYPMEDLELLEELQQRAANTGEEAPAADVEQPAWMSADESWRLSTTLYVADFLTQFSKQLGCRALNYEHLERVLADATSGGGNEDEYNASTLHTVYERLIELILEDMRAEEEATAQQKRWAVVLSEGTWPEVLRRFVLTQAGDEELHKRPDRAAIMSASMLAYNPVDSLTNDQHLALLRFLTDAALCTAKMRGVLQRREDEAVDAKRDVREELAEQRKQLKELLDAEKEERKRKREEERKAVEEEKAEAEAAAAAAAAAGGAAAEQQRAAQKPAAKQAAAMDVDEPSFELPERLKEFGGASGDKKALLQWRQEQQAEKRRLDKERTKWVADQLRRQREVEAAEKAAREAEKAKQREKEEKEEAIYRAQEELEGKLEKYIVRRAPLGADRRHRRYWWGLAGHRPALYVEDEQGLWGAIASLSELDALMSSLDRRGVRELALAEAIEKRFQTIAIAMQRAERAAAAGGTERGGAAQRERPEPARRSGRQTQQPEFFDPAKPGASKDAQPRGLAALFGPAECAAVEAAAKQLLELQKGASAVAAPPERCASWKEWAAGVSAAAAGEPEDGAATAAAIRTAMQSQLRELEAALLAESAGGLAADGASSDEEGGSEQEEGGDEASPAGASARSQSTEVRDVVDELSSPSKRPDMAHLWRTQRERDAWQADLRQGATAARLAYSAAVLAQQAAPMLATLRKRAASGAGKKGKKGATPAEPRASGKAPAAASRPVSRTNSVAALDAGGDKAGKGKGGKRKAVPPPENMRITRSRC